MGGKILPGREWVVGMRTKKQQVEDEAKDRTRITAETQKHPHVS